MAAEAAAIAGAAAGLHFLENLPSFHCINFSPIFFSGGDCGGGGGGDELTFYQSCCLAFLQRND